ncbi:MAG: type II glyceraldehyde-3-phosphate dehydrogenase [Candidatus Woesearchaeota archaeon]|nr:type II glyceraldehyde-3-phosphate dehydrogenase [Candidatus Woesearchaeota archaeon]
MSVKIAINGYGTIGKRIADAVASQDDMKIIGVVKTTPSFELDDAQRLGFPIFANNKENYRLFQEKGIPVQGTVEELLDSCDIVVDCTPGKMGKENKEKLYLPKNKKAIFQGGEKANVVDCSFNASNNYQQALGKQFVRVVSCNTTGLSRNLGALKKAFGIASARVTLIRRGADPFDDDTGPMNAIVPDPVTIPSHHGPDVKTIIPDLDIVTTALIVPTTLMHVHTLNVRLNTPTTAEKVIEILSQTPRIILVDADKRITSTAKIMEMARDLGRKRSDLFELVVWKNSVSVLNGNELFFMQAVHQESIVVPDNIDCIRAMMGLTDDALTSMKKTDEAMGVKKWW